MELNLIRTELKVKLYGEVFSMRRPTVDELAKYELVLNKAKDTSKVLDHMKEFLESLGLPRKACGSMESAHFKTLVEHVTGQKKS